MLVVPRRHVARIEDLTEAEWTDLFGLVREACREVRADRSVDGYNVGVNTGAAAGQTVEHAYVHVIPRRFGDVPDPRGGVRHVIPSTADYWSARD
jgi:diadenosine tetraphosphate (Ap4A) HIT family hydrolase